MTEAPIFPETTNINERIGYLRTILDSSILSEDQKQNFARDDAGAAVFLGIKPVFIPDTMTWDLSKEMVPFGVLNDYFKANPNSPDATYFLNTIVVIPNVGVININAIRRTLRRYHDVFNIKETDMETISSENIVNLVTHILTIAGNEMELGTVLGFPPGSSKNSELKSSTDKEIAIYFRKGKANAIKDGWTDAEVDILNSAYTRGSDRHYAYEQIYRVLINHQNHIELTEDEIQSYASTEDFDAFGFQFFYIPLPENIFSGRDKNLINEILLNDAAFKTVKDMLEKYTPKYESSILNIKMISPVMAVWNPGLVIED